MSFLAFRTLVAAAALSTLLAAPAAASVDVGPGAIVSTVRDSSGKPVSGALVVADGPTTRAATTSIAGVVTLLGLPFGTYEVRVVRSGYTPSSTSVVVGRTATAIRIVRLSIVPATFANLSGAITQSAPAGLNGGIVPTVAAALTASLATDVLSAAPGRGAAASLGGTQAGETRVELDGIPIAGGPGGAAALLARSALQLDHVDVAGGPALPGTSADGVIGGIINYRTAPIAGTPESAFALGDDSSYGSFAQARFSDTFGTVGVLADVVDGHGVNRADVLKAQVALSPSTSLLAAAYGSHATVAQGTSSITNDAPAYSFDLRTTLGAGSLQGRLFDSVSDTTVSGAGAPAETEDWRIAGLQLGYELPFGENALRIGFERDAETAAAGETAATTQTLSTLRLGTDLQLSRTSRLELADSIGSGTALRRRNDPQVALALRASQNVTLRVAAGSAYATSLDVLGFTGAPSGLPETSFGYRASADAALADGDHLNAALFTVRRYDAFASLSGARASGLEVGFERSALPGRLGMTAALGLTRSYAFGALQPATRFAGVPLIDGTQFAGDPFTKARFALSYRAGSSELDAGSTLLGANNALANRAVTLGDVSLHAPLGSLADLRLGLENLFGQTVSNPALAPLYPPHEFTLAVGRFGGN